MKTERVLGYWYAGASTAAAVVVAVAALLLAIIVTARSIRDNALRILAVAEEIVANTKPIWQLVDTNAASGQLLKGARAISQHAAEAADILEGQRPPAR